jgi:predicted nucleic-acid-binding Zn-ribbon protein
MSETRKIGVLCPECGCLLENEETEVWTGRFNNVLAIKNDYYCPCCNYTENDWELQNDIDDDF